MSLYLHTSVSTLDVIAIVRMGDKEKAILPTTRQGVQSSYCALSCFRACLNVGTSASCAMMQGRHDSQVMRELRVSHVKG